METLAGYDGNAVMDNSQRNAGDDRLFVEFYRKPVLNQFKSNEAGRPVFDEFDFVRITVPGDRNSNFETKVTDEHKRRFASRWMRYKEGLEQVQTGTPLEQWPQMSVGLAATLKAIHVHTVEQLAEMSDGMAQQIMGNFDLRRKAKVFLESASTEAANNKLQDELKKRDEQLADQGEVIKQLQAQMAELTAAKAAESDAKTPAPAAGK